MPLSFHKQVVAKNKTGDTGFVTYFICALSVAGYVFVGYFLERQYFISYIITYLLLFAGYVHLLKSHNHPIPEGMGDEYRTRFLPNGSDTRFLVLAGILFRLLFLFSVPTLSDDYFRFAWDGTMWTTGNNPYTIIPSFQLLFSDQQDPYLMQLYGGMNSPDYFTVYPPVLQFIFGTAAMLFPANLWGQVVAMRVFCFAGECGIIYLLSKLLAHFNLPRRNVLWYALNPLVIIELSGNVHPEGVMLFFLLLAVWLLITYFPLPVATTRGRQAKKAASRFGFQSSLMEEPAIPGREATGKFILSAITFAAAIAVKLIPLMFLPLLIKRLKWKKSPVYFLIIGGTLVILFLPFINKELLVQLGTSINLYFQKFEFNASIYYLVRWIGYEISGFDVIQTAGPVLAAVAFILIVVVAVKEKNRSWRGFFISMQWILTIYLLLATTVHPWYITTLVMLSVITGYRYAIVWSLFIALTYATYSEIPYRENLWLVGVEYLIVFGVVIFELRNSRLKKATREIL